ncbi:MAG TPA: ABC transporter permease subunit [Aridibacter sp.]|nr:ABC transporter permease subunit [Aridibacter sp.]
METETTETPENEEGFPFRSPLGFGYLAFVAILALALICVYVSDSWWGTQLLSQTSWIAFLLLAVVSSALAVWYFVRSSKIGGIYAVILIDLIAVVAASYLYDRYYGTNTLDITGFIAFLIFYLITTALAIWYLLTTTSNSLWADAWRRLIRNKLATFGLIVIWLITLMVVIGPSIIFWTTGLTPELMPSDGNLIRSFPPSWTHPMGTDEAGRDILSRVLQGGRISLMVGIISTIVSLIVGVSYGATAGYLGGRIDNVMMRIVDIIYAIPYILIVIVLLSVFGGENTNVLVASVPAIVAALVLFLILFAIYLSLSRLYDGLLRNISLDETLLKIVFIAVAVVFAWQAIEIFLTLNLYMFSATGQWLAGIFSDAVDQGLSQIFLLFFALGLVSWLTMARVVRGQILSLKNEEFVLAARATGVSTPNIIFRHLVPNALGPVIVYATLTVPSVMLTEAFLSFLGLGVQAPYASWGSLAADGIKNIAIFPWQLIFPGVTMALTLFSLNFLGDGLRDALDPQTRKF